MWDDNRKFWITSEGGLIDVSGGTHDSVSREEAGISSEDAIEEGWVRVTEESRGWWNFEVQNAAKNDTLSMIEDFIIDPQFRLPGDLAAVIETREPKLVSFPVEWKDLDKMNFSEAAEYSFRREVRRPKEGKWYSLRGKSRRRHHS